ncbi:MAG TPA: CoB--CoM heterodisulfide reductase iron-sulfur subunit B family protein [Candidatus Hydrogenedentes bacterium]|nr:CoB--CoM heterodisulfide reductase iron-sulfur subunit B family protein [Candidatus Hydrogenedentota bacterium]HPG65359.1 CoB--CoM heterodisulfide reductase iron-sulfur subunit B family protein [Candidatus Hydrogenedentota bacterium]
MIEIGYYPGCALHGSSNDYEASVQACMKALGVRLNELDDWICCGATAAHSMNHMLSVALPARNLGIAERDGIDEVFAPCPMCSMELIKANRAITASPSLRAQIAEIVELPVEGKTEVINLIQVFERVGLEAIRAAVKKPLGHIQAACYYGCLLTRPPKVLEFDDAEQPSLMEGILEAIGASTVEWNYKTECCGAGMTMAREETIIDLAGKILDNAAAHGANCLVAACPMCHVNLDMKQADIARARGASRGLTVYYLSDLVGLALGLSPEELAINRHFVVRDLDAAPATSEA